MLLKATIAYALVVTVALACAGVLMYGQSARLAAANARADGLTEALNRAVAQQKRDSATLARWQAEKRAVGRLNAEAQEGVQKALQAAQPWSEGDVPPDLQKALSEALRGPQ